jgi:hypothetical protein
MMAGERSAPEQAQDLLDRFSAADDLSASCERFGLLGHQVVAFAREARAAAKVDAERFLELQFDRMLAVMCPRERGEDRNWRRDSARELARSAAREDLEGAVRDLGRLRAALETLALARAATRA